MDLFVHWFAILGIAIRLPEIEGEGQFALFRNAITILSRLEKLAAAEPADLREEVGRMRENFIEWRKQEFGVGMAEQRAIIEASVRLAGERDVSGL